MLIVWFGIYIMRICFVFLVTVYLILRLVIFLFISRNYRWDKFLKVIIGEISVKRFIYLYEYVFFFILKFIEFRKMEVIVFLEVILVEKLFFV